MRCDELINEIHSDLRTSWYQQKSKRYYGYIYILWVKLEVPTHISIQCWKCLATGNMTPGNYYYFLSSHHSKSLHKFTGVDYAWKLNEDNIIRSLECPKSKSTPTVCCHQFGYPQLLNIFGSQRIWLLIF